jgi:signal transduction histidine kinase
LFYLVLLLGGIFAYGIVHALRGRELIATFRAKLLLAFIIVSVIPILVLAYYNRQDALERVEEATLKRLDDQTSVVLAGVQREAGVSAPVVLSQVTDEQCSAIADLVDTDFNLYFGNYLQATSKPEVFTAELLDERISANAYVNIMLRRKNFYAESQSIGKVPYIVGYRPMTTESGTVIGIVSVPTLFRQSEIDEELTQRNVFLFGAYALALLLSIGVGTLFVNQISSPILRLKDATRQIAQGDWDVKLRSDRKDEIGELENAFEEMAQNLKRSQEQRIRAQREAAWREMAKQVAHEIKNPLTPIKLSIQHLRRAYADNIHEFGSVLHQVSSTILEQIDALSRIASEFSHFARMPERKLMYCDVHEVLTEARNLFQQQASVSFSQEFLARKSVVLADREELRRAFINVLRNAIQAMKDEGSIAFKTTSDEDIIDVMITDTGPGIPPAIRDRLFEPNFSTKTDGMGLGLAIVKKTIVELGGTITIESAPGAGTTVTIRLLLSLDSE